ncbi:OmpA family protein [Methylobacterium sp. P31]
MPVAVPAPDRNTPINAVIDLDILFEPGSANLTPREVDMLEALRQALVNQPLAGSRFLITGHTDVREAVTDKRLAQRRAETVRHFLIGTLGVSSGSVTVHSVGPKQPQNMSDPLGPENRRARILMLSIN